MARCPHRAAAYVATAAALFLAVSVRAGRADDVVSSPELRRLVTQYFRAADAATRRDLLPLIERESASSIPAVADAMRAAPLWNDPPPTPGVVSLRIESIGPVDVAYRLPTTYEAGTAHAMVLCMPGGRGRGGAAAALGDAILALGSLGDDLVLVAPAIPIGGSFHYDGLGEADLLGLLREIRRVFHIDSDRVFLFGSRQGADAAWMAAVMHADQFAGLIALEGYPRVPYPDQVYPFLLDNVTRLPVLSVCHSDHTESPSRRDRAVAAHNLVIDALARRGRWPIETISGETTGGDPSDGLVIPPEVLGVFLAVSRTLAVESVSHWFRYPVEGHANWITQTRFRGDVWEGSQLAIVPPAGAGRGPFIADVVQDHLAYVAGRVEGQTITVETRRCATVSLMLPMDLVDLTQPVSIFINGKRRFADRITPSIETMLEVAREWWEFSRPVVARMKLRVPRRLRSR